MRTQLKITLFLVATNSLILLLFGGSVYYFLYNYSYSDFFKRLETRATISAKYNFEKDNANTASYKTIRNEHLERLTNEREFLFPIDKANVNYGQIADTLNVSNGFVKEVVKHKKAKLQNDGTFYVGILYEQQRYAYIVVVSAENYYATHHLRFLRNILIIGFFLIGLVTTYIFVFFSKKIFNPIKKIIDRVKEISTENIHLRLEEETNDTEIGLLITTFNDLLNRLETAFEVQKNFISNASHEFGTPLTSIIGEAEVVLRKPRSSDEYQQTLQSILAQAERINQITQSLLYLAQTGYNKKNIPLEIIRADELVVQVKGLTDVLNPKNKVQLDFNLLPENHEKLKVWGNKQLLYLALSNIVNNACKYSNNQEVNISIASSNNEVVLLFVDKGIGIPQNELQFIYDPFFRASNTHQYEGYGIGLPLARNIIRMHNGELIVSSDVEKGTTVKIKLPLAKLK